MEGAWIECPGLSSGSKSLEERADSTVCPDFLTGEVSGTFRLSSRSQRPKGNGHPISRSILSFTRQAILSKYQRKNTGREPKTTTNHKTATPPSSTWVASYPSCHHHRGTHRHPYSYPPTRRHPHTWFSCTCSILPPIDLDSNLFLGLDLGLLGCDQVWSTQSRGWVQ
jgi:hypothetical protein